MAGQKDTDIRLQEIVELSRLYDLYGNLLNEHKRAVFEDYVINDLSLAEIAEQVGMSRQGVRDVVVRCSKQLYEYEEKLKLSSKLNVIGDLLDEIFGFISTQDEFTADKREQLIDMLGEVREKLEE